MVVPALDEGGAAELKAGAAVGVVGLLSAPSSEEDWGGFKEEVREAMLVGS